MCGKVLQIGLSNDTRLTDSSVWLTDSSVWLTIRTHKLTISHTFSFTHSPGLKSAANCSANSSRLLSTDLTWEMLHVACDGMYEMAQVGHA
jgi:hypothetical protein